MIVKQIWTNNRLRNYNYLIVCPETGEALAIDPLAHHLCLETAQQNGWEITAILNTHEHGDHTGGNVPLMNVTGARIYAHAGAAGRIPGMSNALQAGDIVRVGSSVELSVMDTPGHTMSHVCLLSQTEQPALFCGDTLFNAGAGNCHNGGHPDELYDTFQSQLNVLPEQTHIYPGHDYIVNNLKFTLNREPGNSDAADLLSVVENQDPGNPLVTTLSLERKVNTFFRLQQPGVIEQLRDEFPELAAAPSARDVFLKLRELRNHW